ncbi:MAG: hypothetical protein AAGG02_06890 [Cyanobacteria bacterium P01_H01_bin.15]
MSSDLPTNLDLLVPWEIPLEYDLDDSQQAEIRTALHQLLTALKTPDKIQAQQQIAQIINTLSIPQTNLAQVEHSKTRLTILDIEDYDIYFKVRHIQSDDPALCLVQGLLVNSYQFIKLCLQNPNLNPLHVQQQQQGLISYIHLLTRLFKLEYL